LGEMEQKPADVVCSPPLKERRRRGWSGGRLSVVVRWRLVVDVGNNDFLPPPAPRAGFPCGIDLPRDTPGHRTGHSPMATTSPSLRLIWSRKSGRTRSSYASVHIVDME
jgi:hypothetical protein